MNKETCSIDTNIQISLNEKLDEAKQELELNGDSQEVVKKIQQVFDAILTYKAYGLTVDVSYPLKRINELDKKRTFNK